MCLISKQADTADAIDTRRVQSNISQATVTKRDNANKLWHSEAACADGHASMKAISQLSGEMHSSLLRTLPTAAPDTNVRNHLCVWKDPRVGLELDSDNDSFVATAQLAELT
ncbi:unnamed protein product [Phytophthora lilii]|uniref:Unnamed protein product n=1 Tax=Phytophthora lilii TaxID=2077276 RepID=A0A9W7D7D7_9STRA|nr:unnamed protein product [Phytophthora lilii]